MDSKGSPESNMPAEPPAYRFMPAVPKNRKEAILISVVMVLLAIIITGAVLIGVHMTQKHIEKIIQTTSSGSNGEVTEQTMMVSSQENVVAFHVEGNTSATLVYDYKHGLIGLRVQDRRKCLVMKMDKVTVPSLAEMTQRIENFATQGSGDNSLSYSFREGQLADRTALGTTMNILCNDVPIYWAENTKKQERRWFICVHLVFLRACILH